MHKRAGFRLDSAPVMLNNLLFGGEKCVARTAQRSAGTEVLANRLVCDAMRAVSRQTG